MYEESERTTQAKECESCECFCSYGIEHRWKGVSSDLFVEKNARNLLVFGTSLSMSLNVGFIAYSFIPIILHLIGVDCIRPMFKG